VGKEKEKSGREREGEGGRIRKGWKWLEEERREKGARTKREKGGKANERINVAGALREEEEGGVGGVGKRRIRFQIE